jgi:hypothetical protein
MIQRRNFLEQTRVREYQKQKYQNPYFKKTSRFRPWMFFLAGGFCLIGLLSLPFFLAYAPLFRISEIQVQGLTTIPESEIRQIIDMDLRKKRLGLFPKSSRWFFSEEGLTNLLMSQEPLTSAVVTLNNDTLMIDIKEEVTFIVWTAQDLYVLLNLEGKAIEALDPASVNVLRIRQGREVFTIPEGGKSEPRILAPTIPVIIDKSNTEIVIGSTILSKEKMEHILAIDEAVRTTSLVPMEYQIDTPQEIWMRIMTLGPDVLFDLTRSPEEQVSALKTVLSAHAQESEAWEYIDVRFPENAFVK